MRRHRSCVQDGLLALLGRVSVLLLATNAQERVKLLREAMEKLPPSQREVVELHWFEERPFSEVAQIVGSTEGAVRVRAHRAYKKLKDLLDRDLG